MKRISVRLLFALKRKIFLSETGAPYSRPRPRLRSSFINFNTLQELEPTPPLQGVPASPGPAYAAPVSITTLYRSPGPTLPLTGVPL